MEISQKKHLIGWREWVSLPELGIHNMKAKVDTGARTSALHAFSVNVYQELGKDKVSFEMHPLQHSTKKVVSCSAELVDRRIVSDSGGHREERCVIKTWVTLSDFNWQIEITLTNRDDMNFRMLLGRTALRPYFLVDPGSSYLQGKVL